MLVPAIAAAASFPACDSFGQDWSIALGLYGGSFPGTYLVSGCRDCNASLGCGGALPLDGAVVLHAGKRIYSVTAYNPVGGSCFSTHWTGLQSGQVVSGNVSNDVGPSGVFTLTLHSACGAGKTVTDPSTHPGPTAWQPAQ
jgi:hypothetical protein